MAVAQPRFAIALYAQWPAKRAKGCDRIRKATWVRPDGDSAVAHCG